MTNRENPIHRIKSYLGSGSGSMITDTDPRIRIQIKMIWIRNTDIFNTAPSPLPPPDPQDFGFLDPSAKISGYTDPDPSG